MTDADRAQAAERLLGDPLVKELLAKIESDAVEAMLNAPDDTSEWRFRRDTVLHVRALKLALQSVIDARQEATRPRQAYA